MQWMKDTKKKEPVVLRETYFVRDPRSTEAATQAKKV